MVRSGYDRQWWYSVLFCPVVDIDHDETKVKSSVAEAEHYSVQAMRDTNRRDAPVSTENTERGEQKPRVRRGVGS